MGYIKLVTGGARSGKSSYALNWSEQQGGKRCFIATCPVTDPEMHGRIDKHKDERRGRGWATVEEQLHIAETITSFSEEYDTVLIDCLTLWINNLMFAHEQQGRRLIEEEMKAEAAQLVRGCQAFNGNICMVTNEVGLGIVPDNEMARRYRDLVGRCNRIIAESADSVVLVSCGLPLKLK